MTYKQQQKQQQKSEPNNGAGALYKIPNRKWEITGVDVTKLQILHCYFPSNLISA